MLVYGPWQELCTAFTRQILFEKRDAIFDMALKGDLSFNDPDYREIRALLERSIRFAHEVTVPRLLFYYLSLRKRDDITHKKPELFKAVERISDSRVRQAVFGLVMESLSAMLVMAIVKSPIAMICLTPVYALVMMAHIGRTFAHTVRDHSQALIQIEAERVGPSVDSAAA